MTVKTPTHCLGLVLKNDRHVIHLPVAIHAADAAIYVYRMIEISKIRDLMYFHPVDWFPRFPTLLDRCKFRIAGLHLGVAIHAGLRRRDIRMRGNLHVRMTVPAIHSKLINVNVM